MTKYFYSEIENNILEILKKNNNKSEQKVSLKQIFPTITKRNIDQLIEILTNNARIREDISSYKEIKIDSSIKSEEPLNIIIKLINFLKSNELLSKLKLSISSVISDFSLEDITIIEIKTNTDLIQKEHLNHFEAIENQLLKILWNKLQSKKLAEFQLKEIVEETMVEIKDSHDINLNYQYCLRILSKFNWSRLSEEYTELSNNFKHLFQQEQVTSESYHFKKIEDLHFYMVKVTQKNAHFWNEFTDKQYKYDIKDEYLNGLCAVRPSLNFFDYGKTDVWVSFIANQEIDLTEINYSAIEMYVTMLTSENASFTSHSGISRCPTFIGDKHDRISADLHSFIANATLKEYGDQKSYMITCAVPGMREIIIKTFENKGLEKNCFIGTYFSNKLHKEPESNKNSEYLKDIKQLIKRISNQNKNIINSKQEFLIDIEMESEVSLLENIPEKCKSLIIFNQEGDILQTINSEMMVKEFAWFFLHNYLFLGLNNLVTTITADIKGLASFLGTHESLSETESLIEMEHTSEIEMIGDAIAY